MAVAFIGAWFVGKAYLSWFFFILLYAFAALVLISARAQRFKSLAFNLAFAFLALFLFEAFLNLKTFGSSTAQFGTYSQGGYFAPDPLKGYGAAKKEEKYTSTKKWKTGGPIYDIVYTIDRNGLRVTPSNPPRPEHPVWFFGCSFTIGEGVKDEETLPWVYSAKTGLRTLNFGFHGYGPHQMLRMLETSYLSEISPGKPSIAFYNAISVHIERAAGLEAWDRDGPNYVLDGDTVRYAGRFSDGKAIQKYLDKIGERSLIYTRLLRPYFFKRSSTDLARYVGIVKKASDLVRDKYGSTLVVVLWDTFGDRSDMSDSDSDQIEAELLKRQVRVLRVSRVLPHDSYRQYYIKGDGHPTAEGFAKVANLLVAQTDASSVARTK